jgi:hypothetical protein
LISAAHGTLSEPFAGKYPPMRLKVACERMLGLKQNAKPKGCPKQLVVIF